MREIYEKLGLFYVGKDMDKETLETTELLTLLKNKNFTTHAAIIGMTGSGKTGLGIGLVEEAAIDNIPSIVIDPKGDMGNLCLTDPSFSSKKFESWVADEAQAKGEDTALYAQKIAKIWKEGLESWGQDVDRVERFHSISKTIYTPGSSAGVPINILSSLDVPPPEVMDESDIFASYLKSTTSSLLSLVGIDADPLESKEYILLAQIITSAWISGESLSIEGLIGKIISPPFQRVGVLNLDAFYSQNDRFALATKFNALLASPGFVSWMQGESPDIQSLLYDKNGKAKISIFSIAHLNDKERMFFVTLLLNKYIAWMRRQSGTNALKALLYMDEIYGFFPPTKNPPSKEPMLLMLKQARAFGVGIVLSTQNPVDLDYKGLSNIGTWFIGRLQTTQDIERVIDGLEGKIGSAYEKKEIKTLLANLKKRTFFLKSAHLEDIRLFTTRWVLSYLKGPLKRQEIAALMSDKKPQAPKAKKNEDTKHTNSSVPTQILQPIDTSILQFFEPNPIGESCYIPILSAKVKVHFYQQRRGIDIKNNEEIHLVLDESIDHLDWDKAEKEILRFDKYPKKAPSKATFAPLPQVVLSDKGLKRAARELKEHLYRTEAIELYRSIKPKLESKVGESRTDFIVRLQDLLDDKKEQEIEKLQKRYAKKEQTILERLQRAQMRVKKEEADSTSSMIEAGIAVLGALFGRSSGTKISRAVSKGSRLLKERGDISRAQERVVQLEEALETLEYELEEKIDQIDEKYHIDNYEIENFKIRPRKTDIDVELIGIVWRTS